MRIRFVTPPESKQVGGVASAVSGLRDYLQRHGCEVLPDGDLGDAEAVHHFHGLWELSHGSFAARLRKLGRPYVVSPHGMLEPWAFRNRRWKKLPYFWLFERRLLLGAGSLFVTSAMEAQHLARVLRHPRVEVLPLGCHDQRGPDYCAAREALGWHSDERVILFLSRIDVKKGLDLLLRSLAELRGDWHGWRLVIVGDGPPAYVSSLKSMAATLSDGLPRIDWIGPVWGDGRWSYLQGADLFCLPSHSENFGLAVLEALHAGTPVLTTDQTPWAGFAARDGFFIARPEISSILKQLVRSRSRVESAWMLENRAALSAWAGETFAWDRLVPAYLQAYKLAIGRRQ